MTATVDVRPERAYRPTPYQRDFHHARWSHRCRWISAGVGTGKTVAACMEDLLYTQVIAPGQNGLIVVPRYADFEQTVLRDGIEPWWPQGIWRLRHPAGLPEIHVDTPKGTSIIYVRTGSNRRAVMAITGFQAAWAHFEEGAKIPEGTLAWYYTQQRLRGGDIDYTDKHGVRHQLSAPCHVSSTPWPGWLVDEFGCGAGHPETALEHGYSPKADHWIRQARTSDNPHTSAGYKAVLYAGGTDSEWAQQELEGQIVQASGRMVPQFHPDVHVVNHEVAMALFRTTHRGSRGGGVDYGWSPDPAALVWGGLIGNGARAVVVGEWYKHQDDDQAWVALQAQRDYGIAHWYHPHDDPGAKDAWRNGFYHNGQRYTVSGVHDADTSRASGWATLRNLCGLVGHGLDKAPGLIVSERCEHLIRELVALRRPTSIELTSGTAKGGAKQGQTIGDDHAADALRYWLHTACKQRRASEREVRLG